MRILNQSNCNFQNVYRKCAMYVRVQRYIVLRNTVIRKVYDTYRDTQNPPYA